MSRNLLNDGCTCSGAGTRLSARNITLAANKNNGLTVMQVGSVFVVEV